MNDPHKPPEIQNWGSFLQNVRSGATPMGSGWANPRAPGLRGHPQGALHSSVPADKGAPFQRFPIVWLRNSYSGLLPCIP